MNARTDLLKQYNQLFPVYGPYGQLGNDGEFADYQASQI